MKFDVEVHNEGVLRGLQLLRRHVPRNVMAAIKRSAEAARHRIIRYPPELPGQTYERTGTYGAAWDVTRRSPTEWQLRGSAVHPQTGENYTHLVGGDAFGRDQASIHKGRWQVAYKAVTEEVADLAVDVEPSLQQAIRQAGL